MPPDYFELLRTDMREVFARLRRVELMLAAVVGALGAVGVKLFIFS